MHVSKGVRAGESFVPTPWQRQLINALYERRADGLLRYKRSVIGLGRKNGKSLIGSLIALYGLIEGKLVLGMERISEAAALEIAGHRGVLLVEGCVEVEEAIGRHRELYPLVEVAGGRLPEGSEFEGVVS